MSGSLRKWVHGLIFRKETALLNEFERERARNRDGAENEAIRSRAVKAAEAEAINSRLYGLLKSLFLDGEIESIGDTKANYSELKELWEASHLLILYPFPIIPINVKDDGVTLKAEWSDINTAQREDLTVKIYGATGKFLHINEHS